MNSKLLFFIFITLISGCMETNIKSEEAGMIGYIVKHNDSKILVVSQIPSLNNKFDAVWVRTLEKSEMGQKVEVIFEGEIQTSYPGQGVAKKINILPMESPKGSIKSAETALKEALDKFDHWELPVIKEITYLAADQKWSILLFDAQNTLVKEQIVLVDNHSSLP